MTRRLIMWNLMTLDGYFEGPKKWDLDFHERVYGPELEELGLQQLDSAGAILFGRVTYEGMASHWPSATGRTADRMNRVPKIVFSRTLEKATWNNTRLLRGSAEEETARLKSENGGDLYVIGSADLSGSLMARDSSTNTACASSPLCSGRARHCSSQWRSRSHSRRVKHGR